MWQSPLHQCLRQLESNASAAKRFARILTARLIRIQHRECMRSAIGAGQMVVGDDQIHTEASCGVGGSKGSNAGIDADDELNTGSRGPLDDIAPQVIAFLDAMWNVELGSTAAKFDRRFQNDDGGGAVDVIVAIDENAFFALDGGVDAINGSFHAQHQIGRMKLSERRIEKTLGGLRISDSANGE